MRTNVHILRYLWEIGRELPGSWKQKKRILAKMRNSIQGYASDGENISYNQIKTRFGDPMQIAATYVSEMESEELLNAVNAKRVTLHIALIAAVFAVALWAVFVLSLIHI